MREPLDLSQEEREECIIAYTDDFRLSNGGALAEVYCRSRLRKIGLDEGEIDYLIRMNRP